MNNLLITGGAGFIGSNFIRLLLSQTQYNIINFDALSFTGNLSNTQDFHNHSNYRFIKGNICNKQSINQIINEFKIYAIINFAAETHVDRSLLTPSEFIQSNILGVEVLLEAAVENHIERFIQISTDEVYGSADPNESFNENSLLQPNSPYAASKASADLIVRSFIKSYKVPAIIVRSSNNFGQYQHIEKFIPLAITCILNNQKIPIYGTGENRRDWLYVEDNCRAILSIFENGKIGEIYNVSANNEKSNLEIADIILNYFGKSHDFLEFVEDRPAHDLRYSIDSSKLRHELDWMPTHSFYDAINRTIEWYINNKSWINNILKDENFQKYYSIQYRSV
ncbi:MAG TPA: dTDP-glucose 4,6-dehydratase [Candidatus Kapabacteria bacterium]|jgi:dTDP-glucose 4,6-dehydratase|nr:dTDP-glucose 4,6-dehydratase [Candidatus Kapabacteria bacterium]HOV93147.1 dTDP-glucose 4,6-dehydratase [Candidatus Kapabacteria bacterium]